MKAPKTPRTAADWYRIQELYEHALTLPADERAPYLKKEDPDGTLRQEVESLLGQENDLENFLEQALTELMEQQGFRPPSKMFSPGDTIGDFKIKKILGSGGFGAVYLAEQMSLAREVALKVSPNLGVEAKTLAYLEHDHIVKVYSEEVDEQNNLRLVCMQYVPGADLHNVIAWLASKRKKWSFSEFLDAARELGPTEVPPDGITLERLDGLRHMDIASSLLWIVARIAEALDFAHQRNIFHLDIKPGNILLTPYGRPVLTDFGVALDQRPVIDPQSRNIGGTTDFMSPEHREAFASGKKDAFASLDASADIYSLGRTLQELAERARRAGVLSEKARRQIDTVVAKATANDKKLRYGSAREMQIALDTTREILSIRRQLPKSGLSRFAYRFPFFMLTFAGAIPQLAASSIGIAYNQLHVVNHLNPEQMGAFVALNRIYNPVLYGLVGTFWTALIFFLRAKYVRRNNVEFLAKDRDDLRRKILRVPTIGVWLTTISWLPTAAIFPIFIAQKGGALEVGTTAHLSCTFVLGWLIAMSYSFLLHQAVTVRALYPHLWPGEHPIHATARGELAVAQKVSFFFSRLTVLIPLFAASLLLFLSPEFLGVNELRILKQLLFFLLLLSGIGVFSALSLHHHIQSCVEAFLAVDKK